MLLTDQQIESLAMRLTENYCRDVGPMDTIDEETIEAIFKDFEAVVTHWAHENS